MLMTPLSLMLILQTRTRLLSSSDGWEEGIFPLMIVSCDLKKGNL